MSFDLVTVPCRTDNYAFLLHDRESGRTALVDAPESPPIKAALDKRGWSLHEIWLTHHHDDHVEGVEDLRAVFGPTVTGGRDDAARLPALDREVGDGDRFDFAGAEVRVLDVSGHTVGHIAFHVPDARAAFTGDSLMALGCGRVFEGTAEQMWRSLSRLADLPDDTLICSGHEYTAKNARFAFTIDPDNPDLQARAREIKAARGDGRATVPSLLGVEKSTNPFLRARLPEVKAAINMTDASDAEAFAEIRRRKDAF
ncbi:hydroxyacylglutathione hydrolase [Roseitranquillus sediminis]|uniref:hydroxyacylglutathione hydrolase n=1 Tax=Roseitranquillus sediminis TaxID=2809051 RepID=UPI001D0C2D02|nr:hydroxyacylglutathione hydrolase [Roseitranquillus sediminis]MBM9595890.1 hydroxyacylglutathione hydrolase [Roseitranquillus sediminis]